MSEEEGVLDLMVESLTRIADGVLQVTLVDPDGYWLPEWTPGAHIDIETPAGPRQYSLCGDPEDRTRYTIGVLRESASRGGSTHVHDVLRPGDLVEVGGPRNHFELLPAKRYLFIAGGIGITPLLPMIRDVEARGEDWKLVYGGRSRASMGFLEKLAAYGDKVELWPEDEHGLLPLDRLLTDAPDDLGIYCCGPSGLLDVIEGRCETLAGVSVHLERFTAKDLSGLVDTPFTVICAKSEVEREVPAGTSVLDVLEQEGISVSNACREGVCGSCEVAILDGTPEHRDSIRVGAELDDTSSLAVCVSRATTPRLVLDI
ncbi:PDR/VanB family oxidoreductase [Nocardioides massiliensis]|uniref:Ferredoxin-NADP reductase n=1 Tax=Nocardioides massiliensis TaxID=1325935 RepID=A0ABT9NN22_9ACTN|nr:PDR/VanB family oxidoreductase [Nocardioides massiliensis]MDP9821817.1 ferredoxin-NADP reductase [Nocardioides massiliensis]